MLFGLSGVSHRLPDQAFGFEGDGLHGAEKRRGERPDHVGRFEIRAGGRTI